MPGLGRIHREDDKDWTVDKLHAALDLPEPNPNQTLQQALDSHDPFYSSWPGILALWRWIRAHIHPNPPPAPAPGKVLWADPTVLDQGDAGTCVGNGWAGFLAADPVEDPGVNETEARAIYYESTIIGGSPDNPDVPGGGQQGSTVRDGAKAVVNRKRIAAYAFAASVDDVDHWLDQHGPVVIGIDWTNDMFSPDAKGVVQPTGGVAGGHCVVVVGRDPSAGLYECVNSWGTSWGDKGHFRISRATFALLLKGIDSPGEACLAVELPL